MIFTNALPFGGIWYGEPNAISNAIGYAKFRSRSHDAVTRVYDDAGNVIETHEHADEFRHASTLSEVTHDNHVVIAFHAHIVKAWR